MGWGYIFLWFLVFISVISAFHWLPKQPIKDWVIVFCFKAFLSGFVDSFVVAEDLVSYPVRLLPDVFEIHIVFDLMVFPILCVYFNQTTLHSRLPGIILQSILYGIPIALFEWWAEVNTELINHHNWWNIFHSFLFMVLTFLLVRAFIALIRKYSDP